MLSVSFHKPTLLPALSSEILEMGLREEGSQSLTRLILILQLTFLLTSSFSMFPMFPEAKMNTKANDWSKDAVPLKCASACLYRCMSVWVHMCTHAHVGGTGSGKEGI